MQAATVPSILSDYLPLVLFIGVSAVIGLALLIAPFAIAYSKPDAEKLSAYSIVSNWPQEVLAKYDALRMVRHSAGIRKLRLTTVPFSYDMREWIGESSENTDFRPKTAKTSSVSRLHLQRNQPKPKRLQKQQLLPQRNL